MDQLTIVIVDNNSSDSTLNISRSIRLRTGNSLLVLQEHSQGKGNAVRKALSRVDAACYVMCDADDTYNPRDLPALVNAVLVDGWDMVVADRHSSGHYSRENTRPLHNIGNILISKIVNRIYKADLRDILSGYRAFSPEFIHSYSTVNAGFELETDLTIHALDKKLSILEIQSNYKNRPLGSISKLKTYSDGRKILNLIVRLIRYYKPILFFSIIALAEIVAAVVFGLPSINDFAKYRIVTHLPSAILATGFAVIATLTFLVGIIIDSINHVDKKYSLSSYTSKN